MTLTTMGDNSFKPYFNDNIVLNCKQTFVYCRRFCYCDKSVKDKYPTMHCSFSLPSGTICNQCKNPVLLLTLK